MKNGNNPYGISFAQIQWFDKLLARHENVAQSIRHDDIVWDIARGHGPEVQAICVDEYTCGIARVLEVLNDFPRVNLIYVGGAWNHYTMEAKDYCVSNRIGLFNTTEMTGALHKNDFWNYYKKDKDGNPVYG